MKIIIYAGVLLSIFSFAITAKRTEQRRNRTKRSRSSLNHEANFETNFAKNIIDDEEQHEQEHIDAALGADNFFNDMDHMILQNSNPSLSKFGYELDNDKDAAIDTHSEHTLASGKETLQSIGFEADKSDKDVADTKSSIGVEADKSDKDVADTKSSIEFEVDKSDKDVADTKSSIGVEADKSDKDVADTKSSIGFEADKSDKDVADTKSPIGFEADKSDKDVADTKSPIGFEANKTDKDVADTKPPKKKLAKKIYKATHPTKKHVVHAKNVTKKSPFEELYGKEEIKDAIDKAGVGGDKRQIPADDAITIAQGSMQRGIQPDQPFHMDDVHRITDLQNSIGFPNKLISDHLPDTHNEDDDDGDDDYSYRRDDNIDSYDSPERGDDDDDDYDDDEEDDGYMGMNDARLVKDHHSRKENAYTRTMSDNVKKASAIGNVDDTEDISNDEDDDEEDGRQEDQDAERKSITIPQDMLQMAEEKGLETLHDDDHLSMDAHAYHVYHPPNHLKGRVYTKYSHHETHQSISQTNPCENGGIYAPLGDGQHVCICHEKFLGKNCEDLNYCYHRPCKHCGKCQLTKQWPHYKCECCKTYSGKHCEVRNPCEPNPCMNEGECTHDGRTPSCVCKPKFKGKFCGDVNNCIPSPCLNGGTCFEKQGEGNFWCECPETWLGTVCQFPSLCAAEPCHNGGTCNELGGKFKCMCVEGYSGKTCSEKICTPNPCFNGGTCVDDGHDYHCICPPWAQGKVCTEISPCLMNPCHNAARCIDRHSGFRWALGPMEYYCLCQPPYYGPHCEVNKCKLCDVHAHCEIDHCECDEGYEGDGTVCTKLPSPCHPNPCHNNGLCIDEGHGFFHCRCKNHYKPPNCIEVNPCIPSPCNGGVCVPQGIGGFRCVNCPEGFTGKRCQIIDPCETNPCQHHGTCIKRSETDESFGCKCINHWSGKVCEVCGCPKSKDPNQPHSFCNEYGLCACPEKHDWNPAEGKCEGRQSFGASMCDSQPCQCGGTCIPDIENPLAKYTCQCPAQCSGQLCEIMKYCFNHSPCKNGGTCIDVNDYRKYTCKCPPGFSGQNCTARFTTPDPPLHGPCQGEPCQHNGICVPVGESYDCKCITQFMGAHCEIDKCKDCDENARCLAGECVCHKGFIGNGYVCVKDCKRKCKDLMVCVEGSCQCMPGYNLVQDFCVHIPVEVEEDDDEPSDDPNDVTTTDSPQSAKPTKAARITKGTNADYFKKKPNKKPKSTEKPKPTSKSEYEKPKEVTLSPRLTQVPITTENPITPTAPVPVISTTSLGISKTTIKPGGKTTTPAAAGQTTTSEPEGMDTSMNSIGAPGEKNGTDTDQGPPGIRHNVLKGGEQITEIIEPGGKIKRIEGDDEGIASAAEEKLRAEDESEEKEFKKHKVKESSEVFRLAVNYEKDTQKSEEKRNHQTISATKNTKKIHQNRDAKSEQKPRIKTKHRTKENTTQETSLKTEQKPQIKTELEPKIKVEKQSEVQLEKPEVKTKESVKTKFLSNSEAQPHLFSATERILKHIQKLEKTFSQDIATEKSDKSSSTSPTTSSSKHIPPVLSENGQPVDNPLRTTIKSTLNDSTYLSSPTVSKSPESWHVASTQNSITSETSAGKSKVTPVDIERKTLHKPSITVLASSTDNSNKNSEDVFSVPDNDKGELLTENRGRKLSFSKDIDTSSSSDSKEDFVELLKQYGKLKDEVTELAYTKSDPPEHSKANKKAHLKHS